jgi:hypothetical protein
MRRADAGALRCTAAAGPSLGHESESRRHVAVMRDWRGGAQWAASDGKPAFGSVLCLSRALVLACALFSSVPVALLLLCVCVHVGQN